MKKGLFILLLLVLCAATVFAEGKYYISDIAGSGTPEDPYWLVAGEIAIQEQCDTVWGAAYTSSPLHPWALIYVDSCLDYTSFLGLSEVNKVPSFGIHVKLSAMSAMAKDDITTIFLSRDIPSSCFDNSVCYADMLNCVCRLVPGFSTCDVAMWGDY